MRNKTAKRLRKYAQVSKIDYKEIKKVYKMLSSEQRGDFNNDIMLTITQAK